MADRIKNFLHTLKVLTRDLPQPMCTLLAQKYDKNPFVILISCLLSLRARDTATLPVVEKLLARARTPQEILKLSHQDLEKIIYSLGFYHKKASTLHAVSADLIKRFDGKVPETFQDLMSLPGVGRKTANLVLTEAFDIPAIAVDTHVHRLANKWGLVLTSTPEATEKKLRETIPPHYWQELHRLLVMCGQNKCDRLHTLTF